MTDLQSKTGTYFREEAWEGDGGGREMVGGGRWWGEGDGGGGGRFDSLWQGRHH